MCKQEDYQVMNDFLAGKVDSSDFTNSLDERGANINAGTIITREVKEIGRALFTLIISNKDAGTLNAKVK